MSTTDPLTTNPLQRLKECGQSVWLDYIRRELVTGGELRRLVEKDGIAGVTSNPTIFEKAVSGSADYDDGLRSAIATHPDADPPWLFERLAVEDVEMAADVLPPVYEATDGADGFVSIEVSPLGAKTTRETILASRAPSRIYLSRLGVQASRTEIVSAFDRGASLLSYIGHGGIHLWASEDIFHASQVSELQTQPQQPLVLTLNCLNGDFHFPYINSLGEELVKAEGRGAISAFSPSGLSLDEPAQSVSPGVVEFSSGRHRRLGDAVLAAQAAYTEAGDSADLLRIYHLLGDPALKIR